MIYNPLNEMITRKIDVPVYYTGLKSKVSIQEQEGKAKSYLINRHNKISLTFTIPAKGYNYFILK